MVMNRLAALAVGIAVCLTTQAAFGQCSGGGGGSGRSGFGMPTSSNATAYSNQQYTPGVSSNNAAFAVAMQSQRRQQMELMNQQMMMQQMQLESMRQQMIAKQASDAKARQAEMIALRKERNKEKESQKSSARLASTKAKKTSLN